MISPQSKHLFQRAIIMSGSALNPLLPTRKEHSSILYELGNFSNVISYLCIFELYIFRKALDDINFRSSQKFFFI